MDSHEIFQERSDHLPLGGNLSVRKKEEEKALIFIGQDESIFRQFTLTTKQWTLPNGACAPNPKEEGQGVMLSSFVSRDFGYGFDLTTTQLAQINNFQRGESYLDEEAAVNLYGKKEKQELTSSPFVRWLEYGQNNDGYWNYDHMIIQFEDVVDVLHALFHDQFDFIFYFDHSSGHDRLRPNGLNANTMNKLLGGAQAIMRESEIKDESYLGNFFHPAKLSVGDIQSMQFKPTDAGPFYLTPEERESRRNDSNSGETYRKKYTKAQLSEKILQQSNGRTKPKGTLKDLQAVAQRMNIPVDYEKSKITEGWVGKPKGML